MTYEEALGRHSEKYSYWSVSPLDKNIMWNYPELDHRTWVLLNYFVQFKEKNEMETITIDGAIYYWLNYSMAVSRLWILGITTTQRVSELFAGMCGTGKECVENKPYFFTAYKSRTQTGIKTYFAPTKLFYQIINPSGITIRTPMDDVFIPSESQQEEEWIPSDDLKKFREGFYEKNNDYVISEFFKKDGSPTKYWQDIEKYINALKEGTFISQFGERFTEKVKEIPAMTLHEVIDIAASVRTPKEDGKPNVKEIFTVFDGKFSRFVNKYYKDKPSLPELDPVKVAKWREAYPYIDQEGYGLTQLYGKIKGLTKEWDWAYYIADKVENFYDDDQMASLKDLGKTMTSNQRKAFVKLWLEAYRGYQEQCKKFRKDPKWETLEEWVADTKVGESKIMSPWYLTAAHIYRTRGWWIIDSKSAQEAIKKFIENSNKNRGDW